MNQQTAEDRTAAATTSTPQGQVVLMNRFAVASDRDAEFRELWGSTSQYFIRQPGFVSLRLHKAVSDEASHRWVNVATWESEADYRAAHSTDEFRRIVTQPAWRDFPSEPVLFEVETTV